MKPEKGKYYKITYDDYRKGEVIVECILENHIICHFGGSERIYTLNDSYDVYRVLLSNADGWEVGEITYFGKTSFTADRTTLIKFNDE